MSITGMYQKMEDIKKDASRISNLSSDFEQQKNKNVQLTSSVAQMNEKVKYLEDKHRNITELMANKANLDDVTKLSLHIDEQLENLKNDVISKEVFKQNLDEITLCFQEFILSSNTPRPALIDNRWEEFENKIREMNERIEKMEEFRAMRREPQIRQAFDIEHDVPKLELPEKYFKKPEKKK